MGTRRTGRDVAYGRVSGPELESGLQMCPETHMETGVPETGQISNRRNNDTGRGRALTPGSGRVIAFGRVVFCACLFFVTGVAATVRPEMEVQPATIELSSPAVPADFLVVFRNTLDQPIEQVTLTWFGSDEFEIAPGSPLVPGTIPPHAESAWKLRVSRKNEDIAPGTLHFRMDYTASIQGGPRAQVVTASARVDIRGREPLDKLVDVQIITSLETLDSSRSGSVNLVFKSKTARPVVIKQVTASGPDFLKFKLAGAPDSEQHTNWLSWSKSDTAKRPELQLVSTPNLRIPPQGSRRLEYLITAAQSVEPGKYLLNFDVLLLAPEGGAMTERTVVANHELIVGVLGESAISKAVGVGSFLLAPGWLFLMTAGLLFRLGWLRTKLAGEKLLMEVNSPEFWLVAVTISLLFAVAARILTGRWYFVRYGLEDIVWVWMISIGLGVCCYFGIGTVRLRQQNARTPAEEDSPVDVLKKLAAQKLPLVLPRVTLKGKGEQPGFLIETNGANLDPAWVSPAIVIDFTKITDKHLREKVRKSMTPDGRPAELAHLLEHCPQAVAWAGEPIQKPQKEPLSDRALADDDILVRDG